MRSIIVGLAAASALAAAFSAGPPVDEFRRAGRWHPADKARRDIHDQAVRARRRAAEAKAGKLTIHDAQRFEDAQFKRARKAARLRAIVAAGGMAAV